MSTYLDEKNEEINSIRPDSYELLDSIVDWVRVIDNEGTIVFANKSMIKSLQVDPKGMNCFHEPLKGVPKSVYNGNLPFTGIVKEERRVKNRIYSIQSSPVLDHHGEMKGRIEVFRDITGENNVKINLINANRKLYHNISFAKLIQSQILPAKSVKSGLNIDYRYIPSDELSGDFFDIIRVNDDLTAIYICDVVGHGVGASMLTMFVQQSMRSIIVEKNLCQPNEVLKDLHKKFERLQLGDEKYLTMFYGLYQKSTRKFFYSNAGHIALPLWIKKHKCHNLQATGFPIAPMFADFDYKEQSIHFNSGEKILLYTDGITETRDFQGELFGDERLCETATTAGNNLLDNIIREVNEYRWGEQEDDIALLLVEAL